MPSPFGHALGGVLTAWFGDLVPPAARSQTPAPGAPCVERARNGLTVACAVLAASPDIDLLFNHHRTLTHSVCAVFLVASVVALVRTWQGRPVRRVTLTCAAAYASHLLLDWMAVDNTIPRGVQLLWPFDHRFYISGWNLFWQTERRAIFTGTVMRTNVVAVLHEMVILLPPLAAVWLVRVKTLARFAAEMPGRNHPAQ